MEAQFRGKAQAYGPVVTESKAAGKRSLEWDLNDWKWDGDRLVASSVNPVSADCRSRQFLPVRTESPLNNAALNSSSLYGGETSLAQENGNSESENRIVIMAEDEANEEAVALNLKLGGKSYPLVDNGVDKWEGRSGKKTKVAGNANSPACQVENCDADLTNAKDYHRRHKVCEMHSKATQALVGNDMQRFCQQCSRFHALQEFDEGKRSCRRRLAGHNRRRRKTHPETAVNAESLNGEKLSSYLLISLLRVLTNLHSCESNQTKDQDLLSQLLRNLQGETNGTSILGLAQGSQVQGVPNVGTSITTTPDKDTSRDDQHCGAVPSNETHKGLSTSNHPIRMLVNPSEVHGRVSPACDTAPARQNVQDDTLKRRTLNNIDLNNACIDSQDCLDDQELAHASVGIPFWVQKDSLKSSPPQTSRNSGSASTQSPSSSSGSDSQSRTDRIIFKLFGKDPGDLPHLLRTQLLEWLSQSPTDIEGYIRPGCIVLTVYLRLNHSSWEELCCQLSSKLSGLLDMPNHIFWRTGWIYTRVQHSMAFVCDGRVVLATQVPLKSYKICQIVSISPIAVPAYKPVQFVVRGYNLSQSTSRLLCALDGNYLVEESCSDLFEDADTLVESNDIQCFSFSCSIPNIAGRGFIEVEDSGMSGSFFPFIVADPEVCSEICTLEKMIESAGTCEEFQGKESAKMEPKIEALEFIHEMGWLLHRSSLRLRLRHVEGFGECFPFERFKWLLEFSMDHAWPAVLKKLLDLLFDGVVDSGAYPSVENALLEVGLLHHAVRKNSKCLVESLLRYVPGNSSHKLENKEKQVDCGQVGSFLFRPDAVGPGGLTPLHIAASSEGFEDVLDALFEDPGMMGIEAWKTVRDNTGMTPSDYASLKGHYSYIDLVQQKMQKTKTDRQVVVDIPASLSDSKAQPKHPHSRKPADVFQLEKLNSLRFKDWQCNVCERKVRYGQAGMAFTYRPAMLSMVAVAAVCVCVALLFKTLPVVYLSKPFRWETLKYGAI